MVISKANLGAAVDDEAALAARLKSDPRAFEESGVARGRVTPGNDRSLQLPVRSASSLRRCGDLEGGSPPAPRGDGNRGGHVW